MAVDMVLLKDNITHARNLIASNKCVQVNRGIEYVSRMLTSYQLNFTVRVFWLSSGFLVG